MRTYATTEAIAASIHFQLHRSLRIWERTLAGLSTEDLVCLMTPAHPARILGDLLIAGPPGMQVWVK